MRHRGRDDDHRWDAVTIGLFDCAAVEHIGSGRAQGRVKGDTEHRMSRTPQSARLIIAKDQKNGSWVVAPTDRDADPVERRDELTLRIDDDGCRCARDVDEVKADGEGAKSGHRSIVDRPMRRIRLRGR